MVTIRSPSPKDLGYEPNEPNTMNLQRVGERDGLLANGLTDNKDLKDEQTQKNTDKAWWTECPRRWIVIWTIEFES